MSDLIVEELECLKQSLKDLIKRINVLEYKIENGSTQKQVVHKRTVITKKKGKLPDLVLEFKEYLKNDKNLASRSVSNYVAKLKYINDNYSKFVDFALPCDLFEVNSIVELNRLKNELYSNDSFNKMNLIGHHSFSAALNNYIEFVSSKYSTTSFEIDD